MLDGEQHHTIELEGSGPADYRSVVAFFARQLPKELRLVGGYELLHPKVKSFVREHLFEPSPVDLEDPVVLRNLSEPEAGACQELPGSGVPHRLRACQRRSVHLHALLHRARFREYQ